MLNPTSKTSKFNPKPVFVTNHLGLRDNADADITKGTVIKALHANMNNPVVLREIVNELAQDAKRIPANLMAMAIHGADEQTLVNVQRIDLITMSLQKYEEEPGMPTAMDRWQIANALVQDAKPASN